MKKTTLPSQIAKEEAMFRGERVKRDSVVYNMGPSAVMWMTSISLMTLYSWRKNDLGPPWRRIDGKPKYDYYGLLKWIEENRFELRKKPFGPTCLALLGLKR